MLNRLRHPGAPQNDNFLKRYTQGRLGGSVGWASDSLFQPWITISHFMGSSPMSGSMLLVQPAWDSLSVPSLLTLYPAPKRVLTGLLGGLGRAPRRQEAYQNRGPAPFAPPAPDW